MAISEASKSCEWQVVSAQSEEHISLLFGHLHCIIAALFLITDHHYTMWTALQNKPNADAVIT